MPMPLDHPRDATIAVVGDGLGSVLVHATAVYLGFRPEAVTIYGPSDRPDASYARFASALGQTVLRSDAGSPFLPADVPEAAAVYGGSPERVAVTIVDGQVRYRRGDAAPASEDADRARAKMVAH